MSNQLVTPKPKNALIIVESPTTCLIHCSKEWQTKWLCDNLPKFGYLVKNYSYNDCFWLCVSPLYDFNEVVKWIGESISVE